MKSIKMVLLCVITFIASMSLNAQESHQSQQSQQSMYGGPHNYGIMAVVDALGDMDGFYLRAWERCQQMCNIQGVVMEIECEQTGEKWTCTTTVEGLARFCIYDPDRVATYDYLVNIEYQGIGLGRGVVHYYKGAIAKIDMTYL